jgi:hypothetical protein
MKYRPLDMFLKQTDELKELIAKYPDYPIVVIVDSEVVADYDYGWWYAPEIRFGIGEILDCEQDVDDEKTYIDIFNYITSFDSIRTVLCDRG